MCRDFDTLIIVCVGLEIIKALNAVYYNFIEILHKMLILNVSRTTVLINLNYPEYPGQSLGLGNFCQYAYSGYS